MCNVSSNTGCYGCGVCAISCPRKLIEIKQNAEGFYAPEIKAENLCNGCGICRSVCAYLDVSNIITTSIKSSYAAYNKNQDIRQIASSGGVAHAIAESLIQLGYKICVVRYNSEKQRAEHYIAHTLEELQASLGSKYIQSYTVAGLREVLKEGKYVIFGTPCMIASIRKMINMRRMSQNFVLVDFFCHGVPSKLLWDKYIRVHEEKIGKIATVSWRDKKNGWHNSYKMKLVGRHGEYHKNLNQGDVFYKLFLGDYCLNDACYLKCSFKRTASSADIRLGDLWGATYAANNEGYSALMVYTDTGEDVLEKIKNIELKTESETIVTEGQLAVPPPKPYVRRLIICILKMKYSSWWRELSIITIVDVWRKLTKLVVSPRCVLKNRLRCIGEK